MYGVTKRIISKKDFGFNILSVAKIENIMLGSLVVEKQLHINHYYFFKKTIFYHKSKAQNQNMSALSVFWQNALFQSLKLVLLFFFLMIMKWLLGPVRNSLQMVYNFRNTLKHQYSLQKSDLLKLQIGKA